MKISGFKIVIVCCFVVSITTGLSCTRSSLDDAGHFLIRVGDRTITVQDFKQAFEIAKTAYPHNDMQNPTAFKAAQSRLLNQLTEELILLERAGELGISVAESEIDAMVAGIKADYPDDEFDQTLLEHAVSYDTWKQRLRTRMLMERVIEEELKDDVSISAQDILAYYEAHYQVKPESGKESDNINKVIVEQLRREKAENAYQAWMQRLQDRYSIQINNDQWERLIGS